MAKHSIQTQIDAVDSASKALHSPASNIMRGTERKLLMAQLQSVRLTLDWVRKNEADIRAYAAALKGGTT